MDAYLSSFCREFSYPADTEQALQEALVKTTRCHEAAGLLQETMDLLWAHAFGPAGEEVPRLDRIAALAQVHPYTVYLLFYILCSEHLRTLYVQKGLSMEIFHDSMLDLWSKMNKTRKIYGIHGAKWGAWFRSFFTLERFGLGRLEFEQVPSVVDYADHGVNIHVGDPIINVHIPAIGPLDHEKVLDSYRRAADFYGSAYPDGKIPFQCESWLLYPRTCKLFPAGNLRRFSADFDVVTAGLSPLEDDRWRIFHVPEDTPQEDYPEDTSLQRSLKAWLLSGNTMGTAVGMFLWQDGAILPSGRRPEPLDLLQVLRLPGPCYNV